MSLFGNEQRMKVAALLGEAYKRAKMSDWPRDLITVDVLVDQWVTTFRQDDLEGFNAPAFYGEVYQFSKDERPGERD